uniref:Serine/threonine-protein kinase PLK n=1 Tax=Steinernema glaseri TaxID=37863 RepID=A0A1I7Z3I5_9BILA
MTSRTQPPADMPQTIIDNQHGISYAVGRFLGKGGFARCYELIDQRSRRKVAGKIVAKKALEKKSQKDKMVQEIRIHQELHHEHVVEMFGHFEDITNIYIILEVCDNRSLMELHKRRKCISEEETRYFMGQIIDGVGYLHDRHIIHRDLKLGNLFLNKEMKVKIGDFGLATNINYEGERKKTLCGTPNYIAPEMLQKKGHSYEVDIWALGCILYTLLCGKPPFETQSLQETYDRIKKNHYNVPQKVSRYSHNLIDNLLNANPQKRPTIHQIRNFDFFKLGYYPTALPTSCLTTAPKFDFVKKPIRTPLQPAQPGSFASQMELPSLQQPLNNRALRPVQEIPEKMERMAVDDDQNVNPANKPEVNDYYLSDLLKMISDVLASHREGCNPPLDDLLDPAASPVFWIAKWVDYSDKYGLGYQLSDDSVGVLFNDKTKMMMNAAGEQLQYADQQDVEQFFVAQNFPSNLKKKVTLLKYFHSYMQENLLKAGQRAVPKAGDELERLPVVRDWKRTRSAIGLHLTNGTLQVNFFEDHEKFILCPLMSAVTCITKEGSVYTITTSKMAEFGFSHDLFRRLKYIKGLVEKLISGDTEQAQQRRPVAPLGARGRSASARGMKFA